MSVERSLKRIIWVLAVVATMALACSSGADDDARGKAQLTVKADANGARVLVNGREVGRTPVTNVEVAAGEYEIRVDKEGYETYRERVTLRAGQRVSLLADLKEVVPPKGHLYVRTDPGGARVRILNIVPKFQQGMELAPGRYHVEVTDLGFAKDLQWVALGPGEDKSVTVRLEEREGIPPKGHLYVRTDPGGARVRILNIVPKFQQGMELAPGRYHVEVTDLGFAKDLQWVALGPGEDKSVTVRLEERVVEPGAGVSQDDLEAVRLYRKVCDGGDATGCSSLGSMYGEGHGVSQDDREAVRLYRKACDAGDATGCSLLGTMYQEGRGVSQDDREAVRLYRKACDAGTALWCTVLGLMYQEGRGVSQDDREAVRLYRKACDAGDATGCSLLGAMYVKGRGVSRDRREGMEYLRKGCSKGDEWGCDRVKEYNN